MVPFALERQLSSGTARIVVRGELDLSTGPRARGGAPPRRGRSAGHRWSSTCARSPSSTRPACSSCSTPTSGPARRAATFDRRCPATASRVASSSSPRWPTGSTSRSRPVRALIADTDAGAAKPWKPSCIATGTRSCALDDPAEARAAPMRTLVCLGGDGALDACRAARRATRRGSSILVGDDRAARGRRGGGGRRLAELGGGLDARVRLAQPLRAPADRARARRRRAVAAAPGAGRDRYRLHPHRPAARRRPDRLRQPPLPGDHGLRGSTRSWAATAASCKAPRRTRRGSTSCGARSARSGRRPSSCATTGATAARSGTRSTCPPCAIDRGEVVRFVGVQVDVTAYRDRQLAAAALDLPRRGQPAAGRLARPALDAGLADAAVACRSWATSASSTRSASTRSAGSSAAAADPEIERLVRELPSRLPGPRRRPDRARARDRPRRDPHRRRRRASSARRDDGGAPGRLRARGDARPAEGARADHRARRLRLAGPRAPLRPGRSPAGRGPRPARRARARQRAALRGPRLGRAARCRRRCSRSGCRSSSGVELAARFRPAGDGSLIGGDFYDVLPRDGRPRPRDRRRHRQGRPRGGADRARPPHAAHRGALRGDPERRARRRQPHAARRARRQRALLHGRVLPDRAQRVGCGRRSAAPGTRCRW